jgi:serine/threonine-protein kinase RsbW
MASAGLIRIGESPLSVETMEVPPCVVGAFRGVADEGAMRTLLEAGDRLVTARPPRLVLDLEALVASTPWCAGTVARTIREAHRVGKEVTLVRCPDWFYHQLAVSGLGGPVKHAGSLAAATDGLLGQAQATMSLCLRSVPTHLRRLRSVIGVLGAELPISEEGLQQVKTAVGEACANAMTHGSPLGARNQILVSFHAGCDALIVDVADEGPGFDPALVPEPDPAALREHGYGLHIMRQLMDRLECFPDSGGTVVRLTKLLPCH